MKTRYNLFGTGRSLQLAITISCQLAFVLFGYDQGVFGGIVGNEDFLNQFGHPDSAFEGIIVSIYNLGAFSGCILAFFICEKLGRRRAMWLAMCFIITGATLQTTAFTVPHLMIGRYITGIGTGIETSTVPMYQSVGIEIAYWFDYGMSFSGGSIAWRLPISCQTLFAFLVIFLVFGIPESPRYLYAHGRNEEAIQVLCDVYKLEPSHPKIVKEQNDVLRALQMERENGEYQWSELFKRDDVQTGRRVLLAYGMQFMNQMGGINLVVYYITSVLQDNVGLTRNLSLILGGCVNAMFAIGSLFPSFFLDRYGRRNPMMIGSTLLGFCMMLISVLLSFQSKGGHLAKSTSAASVAFFFLYMLIFGATANCIPWVYVPEILPLHVRTKGTAVGISANWLWNFFVVMITPTLITKLAWKGYLIFMALNFAFVPLVYFCYPETANLTLEEMDYLFASKEEDAVKMSVRVAKHGWGDRLGKYDNREDLVEQQAKSGLGKGYAETRIEGREKA